MIAAKIARYMDDKGIHSSALCRMAGLKKRVLNRAFKGKHKLSIEEYEKICTALNVSYDFFFGRRGKTA